MGQRSQLPSPIGCCDHLNASSHERERMAVSEAARELRGCRGPGVTPPLWSRPDGPRGSVLTPLQLRQYCSSHERDHQGHHGQACPNQDAPERYRGAAACGQRSGWEDHRQGHLCSSAHEHPGFAHRQAEAEAVECSGQEGHVEESKGVLGEAEESQAVDRSTTSVSAVSWGTDPRRGCDATRGVSADARGGAGRWSGSGAAPGRRSIAPARAARSSRAGRCSRPPQPRRSRRGVRCGYQSGSSETARAAHR